MVAEMSSFLKMSESETDVFSNGILFRNWDLTVSVYSRIFPPVRSIRHIYATHFS